MSNIRLLSSEETRKIENHQNLTNLNDLDEKDQKKICIEFVQKGIQILNTSNNEPKEFYKFLTHPACLIVLSHKKFLQFFKEFIRETLDDKESNKKQLTKVLSLIYNFCSMLSQFPIGNSELYNEIAIAGVEIMLSHERSPFRENPIAAQLNLNLVALYLQRTASKSENYKLAYECVQKALEYFKPNQQNYATCLSHKALILKHKKKYNEAHEVYKELLKIRTKEKDPASWALTQINLGNLLIEEEFDKDDLEKKKNNIDNAILAFENGLTVFTKYQFGVQWSVAKINVGYAYLLKSQFFNDEDPEQKKEKTKLLDKSISCFDEVLDGVNEDTKPVEMGRVNFYKGLCLLEKGKMKHEKSKKQHLEDALSCMDDAKVCFTKSKTPGWHEKIESKMNEVQQLLKLI